MSSVMHVFCAHVVQATVIRLQAKQPFEVTLLLSCSKFTLATFPFYIDQTIGGAIINGAHGSSTRIGSLSTLLR